MIWVIILLILVTIFLSTTLFFSLRRINQYEDLLVEIERIIKFSTEKMKVVDYNGTFESDDEVGFFFEQLKSLQMLLSNIFEEEKGEEKSKEKGEENG